MTPDLTIVVDELVVIGWSRRQAARFTDALAAELSEALDRAASGGRAPGRLGREHGQAHALGAEFRIGIGGRTRASPERTARTVAHALAAAAALAVAADGVAALPAPARRP